jgi:hypothetical protein
MFHVRTSLRMHWWIEKFSLALTGATGVPLSWRTTALPAVFARNDSCFFFLSIGY